jgi:hypothetical protein
VYKPGGFDIEHPIEIFFTSARKEVAASIVDRLIDLRMVPLTVKKTLDKFEYGSCQYFAENTIRAREMLQYDGSEPSKFKDASGRATKSPDILFFDWLIDNFDRNVDNYVIANDGRVVLIDHGFTFKLLFPHLLLWPSLEKMLPSKRIYDRLIKLDRNPELIRKALKPWLSSLHIEVIRSKIHHFVKLAKKHEAYSKHSKKSVARHTDLK